MPNVGVLFLGEDMHHECARELSDAIGAAPEPPILGDLMVSLFADRSLA